MSALPGDSDLESKRMTSELKRLKLQEERLTDTYLNEAMGLELYKAKMAQLADQRNGLERMMREIADQAQQHANNVQTLKHLSEFCKRVSAGLDHMSFEERQQFLLLEVEGIIVQDGHIRVETIIPTDHGGSLHNVRGELVEPRTRPLRQAQGERISVTAVAETKR